MDPQVGQADLTAADGLQGQLADRPARQRPHARLLAAAVLSGAGRLPGAGRLVRASWLPSAGRLVCASGLPGAGLPLPCPGHCNPSADSCSAGSPGCTQARSSAISAITVVW
jgi:hypothetical protein